ncbi:hypothetical protein BC831DRAFT_471014 [Entophlyctis helioformis]|nr:hypothetical protein BC831DRAFT_471014 [Entophlyctis helioformis]
MDDNMQTPERTGIGSRRPQLSSHRVRQSTQSVARRKDSNAHSGTPMTMDDAHRAVAAMFEDSDDPFGAKDKHQHADESRQTAQRELSALFGHSTSDSDDQVQFLGEQTRTRKQQPPRPDPTSPQIISISQSSVIDLGEFERSTWNAPAALPTTHDSHAESNPLPLPAQRTAPTVAMAAASSAILTALAAKTCSAPREMATKATAGSILGRQRISAPSSSPSVRPSSGFQQLLRRTATSSSSTPSQERSGVHVSSTPASAPPQKSVSAFAAQLVLQRRHPVDDIVDDNDDHVDDVFARVVRRRSMPARYTAHDMGRDDVANQRVSRRTPLRVERTNGQPIIHDLDDGFDGYAGISDHDVTDGHDVRGYGDAVEGIGVDAGQPPARPMGGFINLNELQKSGQADGLLANYYNQFSPTKRPKGKRGRRSSGIDGDDIDDGDGCDGGGSGSVGGRGRGRGGSRSSSTSTSGRGRGGRRYGGRKRWNYKKRK